MGGKKVPAFGFAAGIERLMLLAKSDFKKSRPIAVNYISQNEKSYAFEIAQNLRNKGLICDFTLDGNFKKQMKRASQNNSRFVVIIGETEMQNGEVMVKDFDHSNEQKIKRELLTHYLEGKM
jgi:histidyl-tRNA synthetase